ncbi:MAG TPA: V-type ATP synthase subunit E [Candidatus Krumholzibacterium sp.]|nr:V-type ATP synthase subunit E [Candidatus Krumholzibacterium sp.]
MPIEKIFEKIDSEAETEAGHILDAAREKAAAIREDYDRRAEELGKKLEAYAGKKAGEEEKHLLVSAQLELRKAHLARKREILDSVYEEARKKILVLSPEESAGIIRDMILDAAVSGREEIVVPREQEGIFNPGFVEGLRKAFGKGATFRIAGERGEFEWGVVLREGRRVVDLSLDVVFRQVRERTEPRIAALLFGEDRRETS